MGRSGPVSGRMTARNQWTRWVTSGGRKEKKEKKKKGGRGEKVGLLVKAESRSSEVLTNMDHEGQDWGWPQSPAAFSGEYICDFQNVLKTVPPFKWLIIEATLQTNRGHASLLYCLLKCISTEFMHTNTPFSMHVSNVRFETCFLCFGAIYASQL